MRAEKAGKVSIIMPYYRGSAFVAEAIESVQAQTYGDWELIIVDDGSGDDLERIIEGYLSDGRIRTVRHRANRGIPHARNTGIEESGGEYIALLDQDDLWLPHKLAAQMRALTESGLARVGMVFSDIYFLEEGGFADVPWPRDRVPRGINHLSAGEVLRALYLHNFVPSATALFARECLGSTGLFDTDITGGADDYDMFLRVAAEHKVLYVDERLAIRRLHGANYSDLERLKADELYISEKLAGLFPELGPCLASKKTLVYGAAANSYYGLRDYRSAARDAWDAARVQPRRPLSWVKLGMVCFSLATGIHLGDGIFNLFGGLRDRIGKGNG